jgi:hypothetical protein
MHQYVTGLLGRDLGITKWHLPRYIAGPPHYDNRHGWLKEAIPNFRFSTFVCTVRLVLIGRKRETITTRGICISSAAGYQAEQQGHRGAAACAAVHTATSILVLT